MIVTGQFYLYLVGAERVGIYFHDIALDFRYVVQYVEECRRIECGALELYHLPLAAYHAAQTGAVASAVAGTVVVYAYISGAEAYQRHPFHSERGDRDFSAFALCHGIPLVVQELHYDEIGRYVVAAVAGALGKRGLHFGRGIGRVELQLRPFFVYAAAQGGEISVRLTQGLANAYSLAQAAGTVVYPVFLGEGNEFHKERRHAHADRRVYGIDGVPLQFRYSVSNAYHSHSQGSRSQPVGQSCHEAAVYGGHQLHYVVPAASRHRE